jgi:hypothetical protein
MLKIEKNKENDLRITFMEQLLNEMKCFEVEVNMDICPIILLFTPNF